MAKLLITILQILLLTFLPGAVTVWATREKWKPVRPPEPLEFGFLSILLSLCLSSLPALLLAYLGFFSALKLSGLMVVYSFLVVIFYRLRIGDLNSRRLREKVPWLAAAILVLAGLLYFRPAEYIFGGWDPGVYANTAVHLARTGSLLVGEDTVSSLPSSARGYFRRTHRSGYLEKYPGFRFREGRGRPAQLIPQFYHLYPVWLAIFYSWGGWRGLFLLNPLLGLLSLPAVYLAVRELRDRLTALIAVFLLAINIVQIWQARFPTAEMLSQFLLFSAIYLAARYLRGGLAFYARLAGLAGGLFILSRVSALFIFLPLLVFFYLRWFREFQKKDLNFWIPLLGLTAASLLPHLLLDPRYLRATFSSFRFFGAPVKILLPGAVAVAAAVRLAPRDWRNACWERLKGKKPRLILSLLAAGLLAYGYFLRPCLGAPTADRTNLVELGWLVSFPGLLLAGAGLIWLLLKNRKAEVWFFLLIVVSFSGLFLWQQMIHYYYLWAARRFAVAVVPGFLILAAWCLGILSRRSLPGRLIAAAAFFLVVLLSVRASHPLWLHREYRGAIDFRSRLNRAVRGADLIVVRGRFVDKLPTLLDLGYGYRVLPVYREGPLPWPAIMEAAREKGKKDPRVYLLTDQTPPVSSGRKFRAEEEIPFHSILYERSWDHLPHRVDNDAVDANFTVRIYRVIPRKG